MQLQAMFQEEFDKSSDFETATELAAKLLAYGEAISDQIELANVPGTHSREIQDLLAPEAERLGFSYEKNGLFATYTTRGLRPDFYKPLAPGAGILLEVERGKTTDNNMDLLDFWKCHICDAANILFLFVPSELRQNETKGPSFQFRSVASRLGTFFRPGNETNVHALFLFGY